jgi:hypothetical protein
MGEMGGPNTDPMPISSWRRTTQPHRTAQTHTAHRTSTTAPPHHSAQPHTAQHRTTLHNRTPHNRTAQLLVQLVHKRREHIQECEISTPNVQIGR